MDLFTLRALTQVRAAKKRVTLDTTPTKKAMKRWATLRPAIAPDLNLLGQTILPLSPSWSSLLKWKMRRCWAIPSITPPLMLPGPAAPQRALIRPSTRPKQSAPDITWPRSTLQKPELRHFYLVCFLSWAPWLFAEAQGIRKPAAAMEDMCFFFGSTSGFCMNAITFFFFFLTFYLLICVWRCVSKTKAHPWWMLKRMSKMYCDTFSLYLITFHWSRGWSWALLTDYLPPCSVVVHTLLPPFHHILCSIISDSGDMVKTFHCHVLLPLMGRYYLEVFIF